MRVVPAARDGFDMWLFNYNAISNFLICVLLVIMVGYLLFRSQRNREVLSLILFMAHLLVWQACLLYQNLYFDPAAALPLFYFQHSGYTLLSFLALVMFSYVFIEPVFATEARVVFFAGLLAGFVIIIHFFVSVLPVPPQMRFDVALHVYSASPAGIRPYIIALELMFLAIYAKNMVYKSIRMRGESRLFAIHVAVATLAGAVLIMGGVVLEGAGAVDPRFMQGANTVLAGIVFIYFYWVYINFSRMRYFYADKTFLTIIFIVIIAISLTTALTYGIYRDSYVADRREDARNIVMALDSRAISDAGVYFEELHKADLDFISVRDNATGAERSLFGTLYHFEGRGVDARGAGSERPAPVFASYGATVLFYFTLQGGARTVWTGFSYVAYRAHMHRFVAAGLTTIVLVVFGLFALLRVAIYFGLTRPLRRLLRGIEEIHAGNLYHEIDVNTFDEIGYISQQFNYMVYDLRVTEESIKRSEQKYREIMAMLPDIIYETDLSLRITYLNEAGRRITGYAEDDVHAGVSMTELLDESDTGALRALLAAAPARRSVEFITHRIRRKDGSVFYGENNSVVIDEMGRPAGLRGVIRDVTERLRLERSLLQAQKMKTIGSLAGGIAHDFNNILAGITGTVSLLEYKLAGAAALRPEEIGDDLRIMKTTADRAAKMVRQILALSRMQTPTLALTDLNAVLRHVLDVCKNSFDKKIELDFTFHEGAAYATADETQLEQVVLNLCVNARDAMTIMRPAGSAAGGRIVVRLEHSFSRRGPVLALARRCGRGVLVHQRRGRRRGHGQRDACARVRPVLHHQGEGQGDRAGPAHGVQYRQAARRVCRYQLGAGQGDGVPRVSSHRPSRAGGVARRARAGGPALRQRHHTAGGRRWRHPEDSRGDAAGARVRGDPRPRRAGGGRGPARARRRDRRGDPRRGDARDVGPRGVRTDARAGPGPAGAGLVRFSRRSADRGDPFRGRAGFYPEAVYAPPAFGGAAPYCTNGMTR
ncbi:MAG TPA: PAS domain S-box protein [Spirochaetota bacterium]|nr:PAS domain S-box protein [Spirochaetota bacterium]